MAWDQHDVPACDVRHQVHCMFPREGKRVWGRKLRVGQPLLCDNEWMACPRFE